MTAHRPVRVAVTRPAGSGDQLASLLRAAGAEPVMLPLTRIAPPADPAPFERALERIDIYDWIVFTSANAVAALERASGDRSPPRARIAAVGDATAAAVRAMPDWSVHIVPEEFTADAVVPAMQATGSLEGKHVLWPRSERARDVLRRALTHAGARLDDPIAYRTLDDPRNAAELRRRVEAGEIDVMTFTAPSAVESYLASGPAPAGALHAVLGTTTAAAAAAHRMPVHIQPGTHTIEALVEAVLASV